MIDQVRPALVTLVLFSLLCGLVYPAVITGIAQATMAYQANGSLVVGRDGRVLGSDLIGQPFDDPKYFWSRPSATGPFPYNGGASSGSNRGVTHPALVRAIRERVEALRAADPGNHAPVPVDLVTASGSGLDPHITPAAAIYQVTRVARARSLTVPRVRALVDEHVEDRTLGVLGEPRVNVVRLNRALDRLVRAPGG